MLFCYPAFVFSVFGPCFVNLEVPLVIKCYALKSVPGFGGELIFVEMNLFLHLQHWEYQVLGRDQLRLVSKQVHLDWSEYN